MRPRIQTPVHPPPQKRIYNHPNKFETLLKAISEWYVLLRYDMEI
jgi:hypothetical protein